jgi:thioredoxin 1
MFMAPKAVSDDTFEAEVLNASEPVVVDFWAEWCGPCRMIAPALEEIATELAGKVKIVKMNVDENPRTPGEFGIRGIPALLMFKDGKVAAQKVGAQPKGQLLAWITQSASAKVA